MISLKLLKWSNIFSMGAVKCTFIRFVHQPKVLLMLTFLFVSEFNMVLQQTLSANLNPLCNAPMKIICKEKGNKFTLCLLERCLNLFFFGVNDKKHCCFTAIVILVVKNIKKLKGIVSFKVNQCIDRIVISI